MKLNSQGATEMKRSSIIIIVVATLLGLFFGNVINGLVGALIVGAISLAGAWYAMWRHESTEAMKATNEDVGDVQVQDPPFARFLFQNTRSAALWLPLRIFLGWEWLDAGWHKVSDPKWMDTGEAIRAYWERAVVIPETGRPPITYDWWRGFLQFLIDSDSHIWFGKVIAVGELLVGLGLLAGALVGIAAFSGMLMNLSFLLSGSTSSNPILLAVGVLLVLGWKTAGWLGLDRWLLPLLGTPWQAGKLRQGQAQGQVQAPPRPV
jgi:thiosulfate dehydrogenase [quinone] large subunit